MRFTTKCRMLLVGAMVLQLWPSSTFAQEQAALNLTLRKTHVKTTSALVDLTPPFQDVFTPTEISCPGAGVCLVRLEVSGQFGFLSPGAAMAACVRIDGSTSNVFPACVTLAEIRTYAVPDVFFSQTFAWAASVAPGTHVIQVRMNVDNRATSSTEDGYALVGPRILTIEVLKP